MQNGGRFDEADEQFLFGKTCGDIDGGDGGQVNGDSQFRGGQNIAGAPRYVPMGPPLSDHLEVLTSICQWSCESREIFLETSDMIIGVIYATICNVLSGFYPTNIHSFEILQKHRLGLKKFINLRTSFASKKKILASEETGEAIFFIIKSSVLPFLANYNYMKMLTTQKIHFE